MGSDRFGSQFWQHLSGRSPCLALDAVSEPISHRAGLRRHGLRRQHRPRRTGLSLNFSLRFCVIILLVSGCRSTASQWAHLYSEARAHLEHGDLSTAVDDCEKGFQQSDHRDPAWNWKFRVLKAEILLTQGKYNEVLRALAIPLPADLSNGELAVRRKALAGLAYARLGDYGQAEARFKEAD